MFTNFKIVESDFIDREEIRIFPLDECDEGSPVVKVMTLKPEPEQQQLAPVVLAENCSPVNEIQADKIGKALQFASYLCRRICSDLQIVESEELIPVESNKLH